VLRCGDPKRLAAGRKCGETGRVVMNKLRAMRMFVKTVEMGSLTAAVDSLGSNTGAISRAIAGLEKQLNVRLLNRSTRRIALTEAGGRYLDRCTNILRLVDTAEDEAQDAYLRPAGLLRVHTFNGIGQQCVVPCVASYKREYPDVSVALTEIRSSLVYGWLDGERCQAASFC